MPVIQHTDFITPEECAGWRVDYDMRAPASPHRGYSGEPYVYLPRNRIWGLTDRIADLSEEGVKFESAVLACLLPNGWHPPHIDNGRPNIAHRVFSAIVYLSSDFRGGKLRFSNENLEITPHEGLMVAFPASLEHEVRQVTAGRRYSIAMWFRKR
ncbi:MAG TPA: 2OG-Fe(II) oxygenase [Candidatus Acidoferrales bacterium]|nr:2OG-Fe(II) oxygenase [Candidatus Acidoferrales bacterium]